MRVMTLFKPPISWRIPTKGEPAMDVIASGSPPDGLDQLSALYACKPCDAAGSQDVLSVSGGRCEHA